MDHVQAACDTGNLFGMHRLLISWLLYRTSLHWHTSSTKENIAGVNVSSVTESGLLGTDYYSLFQLLISLHILSVTQELSPV